METTTAVLTGGIPLVSKLEQLLLQPTITQEHLDGLTKAERDELVQLVRTRLAGLEGMNRENFISKIDVLITPDGRANIRNYNHTLINKALSEYMQQYGVMPNINAIAEQTGLSRQTVARHFKEYRQHPEFAETTERFKFMWHKVLASVFKFANCGDMRAARLYFEMVGALNKQQPGTVINAQNNYIQINNTILSQENLKQLSAEQLNQIESIVISNKTAGSNVHA